MFGLELYKTLRKKEIWAFIAIGIILEIVISSGGNLVLPKGVDLKTYKYYLEKLDGEYTDEKAQWITEERDKYQEYIDNSDTYEEQYNNNEIDSKSYQEILENIQTGKARIATLEYLVQRSMYLDALSEKTSNVKYFYDLEVNDYLENMNVDIIVALLIIVIVVHVFSEDNSCGTENMVVTSKNGRRKIFINRFICVMIVSTVIGVVYPVIEMVVKQRCFDLGNLYANVRCLTSMSESGLSMNIKQYLMLTLATRFAAAILFAIIVMGITICIKNVITDYVLSIGLLYLPFLVFDSVGKNLQRILICKGFSPIQGYRMSQEISGIHGMIIWLLFYTVVSGIIFVLSLKRKKN